MSVAAGTYGTVGGGFIRVNGNPMDQSGGMNMNSDQAANPFGMTELNEHKSA